MQVMVILLVTGHANVLMVMPNHVFDEVGNLVCGVFCLPLVGQRFCVQLADAVGLRRKVDALLAEYHVPHLCSAHPHGIEKGYTWTRTGNI